VLKVLSAPHTAQHSTAQHSCHSCCYDVVLSVICFLLASYMTICLRLFIFSNPPSTLSQRFEETHAAAKVIEADMLRLEHEFGNQEKLLEERASEWRRSVESIQNKLQTSFSNYMERLQYMGEIHLRSKDTFMDWGESIKSSLLTLCSSGTLIAFLPLSRHTYTFTSVCPSHVSHVFLPHSTHSLSSI
jgi:hypothetical protein